MKKTFISTLVVLVVILVQSYKPVEKVIPTMLKVTVLDNIGNPVSEAKVTLYEKAIDYEKEINPIKTDSTNIRGKVFFKGLKPIPYYIQVTKGDKSNISGGEVTDELLEGRINKLNVVID